MGRALLETVPALTEALKEAPMTIETTECANCGEAGHPGHHWMPSHADGGGYVCDNRDGTIYDAPHPAGYVLTKDGWVAP